MSYQLINLNPKTTQFVIDIVNALGLKMFKSMYESEIDRHMAWNWGDEDEDDGWGGDGYKYVTLNLVDDGKLINSTNLFVTDEYKFYVSQHIINASVYVTEYATSKEYDMKIDYLLDAGTEKEMLIELHFKMNSFGYIEEADLMFDTEHLNAKYMAFFVLQQS